MKSVPNVPQQHGYSLVEDLVKKVISQVRSNEIDQVYKTSFNYRGTHPVVSIHSGFKFLGTHQVCAWKNKPYSSNPNMIIATFKIKVDGNLVMQFNVTTGVMLTDVYGDGAQAILLERIVKAVTEKCISLKFAA